MPTTQKIQKGAEEERLTQEKVNQAKSIKAEAEKRGFDLKPKDAQKAITKATIKTKDGKSQEIFLDVDGAPKIRGIIRDVPIKRVKPNPWNYNEQSDFIFEKLGDSMAQFGFTEPLTVRSSNEKGPLISEKTGKQIYEIIGGEHRWKKCKEMGMKTIRINDLGMMTDDALKQFMIVLNETKGRPNQDALSGIIADLDKRGVDLSVLPFDDAELKNMVSMADFDWETVNNGTPVSLDGGGGDKEEETYFGIYDALDGQAMPEEEDARLGERLKLCLAVASVPKHTPWKLLDALLDSFYKAGKLEEPSPENETDAVKDEPGSKKATKAKRKGA